MLIRRVDAGDTEGWNPDLEGMVSLWGGASVLFGTAYWLITIVTETRALRTRSFGFLILVKSFAMLATVVCYLFLRGALAVTGDDMSLNEAWANSYRVVLQPIMAIFLLYIWLTTVAFSFVRQMSAMAGPRVLVNLLLGKYHHPKTETRIFMFLDLEGSTTIAEQLGHEKFCRLIQECFRDLTDAAIRRNVEVYQYVGDEAILTWTPKQGLRDCNCLRLFFEFQQTLDDRAEFYNQQFGLVPKFKAGANLGPATVAEVGVLKRDIAYLSDVLNTAARLESMCRAHDARLLITETLKGALPAADDLDCQPVGELEIRGKSHRLSVYRVEAR
jgi:adenylate cyclase